MTRERCGWVTEDEIYQRYHDTEWGSLSHFKKDRYLFEMLVLEGAQAGLSWITILKRRENYRKAFDGFDPSIVSGYDDEKVAELLVDAGIIRNRRKVASTIKNAQAFCEIQAEYGSFHQYVWEFFEERQIKNNWETHEDVPAQTAESVRLSKELKKRGFSFVGPVICYSFMQAVGLVNDHAQNCYLYHKKTDGVE